MSYKSLASVIREMREADRKKKEEEHHKKLQIQNKIIDNP